MNGGMEVELYPDSIVYIVCPAESRSGGPELMHQLASELLRRGVDARMYYVPNDVENPVHAAYEAYHIPYVRSLQDEPQNVLVFPETAGIGDFIFVGRFVRKIFWWMSVDNWLKTVIKWLAAQLENPLESPMPKMLRFDKDTFLTHWVQSEYARQFVSLNGVPEKDIQFVGDYLNPVFLARSAGRDETKKEDIIVYNPNKGMEFTEQLMKAAPELDWRPIQDMTREEVEQLLARAKVYIDFGNHPGRDRIPREAAVSGCCVLTGKRGAAANAVDISIPERYKFDDDAEQIPEILREIQRIFLDFSTASKDFESYRRSIYQEPQEFRRQVAEAFSFGEQEPPRGVAFLELSEEGLLLWRVLRTMPEYRSVCFVHAGEAGRWCKDEDGAELPIYSPEDAAFLYREGRIARFMMWESGREQYGEMLAGMGVQNEDCIFLEPPT